MKILHAKNYDELSCLAAEIVINKVKVNPAVTLGLATGSTPIGVYKQLIKDFKENGTDYRWVKTVNLDEYIGIAPGDPHSYHYFMKKELFDYIPISENQTFLPNGSAEDLRVACLQYDQIINQLGGIDLQILGIGQNGHIGFNEPGSSFHSRTHIVSLSESTRNANARFFDSLEDVPEQAITMGIATIMESKEILLLASGRKKAEAIKRFLNGEISESFPATILKRHPHVTLIGDEVALSYI
ncbi:glucosamine-6-phosphate deaminase [Bacillaceae bacterium Marseille-Q3522]|nr:glucosamine-6-phosphate deaminase [Bacillaceae bacterium Marseille-Q3522]